MPKAIPVAVANDTRLYKCAIVGHRDGAHVIVAQVEVPLHISKSIQDSTLQI